MYFVYVIHSYYSLWLYARYKKTTEFFTVQCLLSVCDGKYVLFRALVCSEDNRLVLRLFAEKVARQCCSPGLYHALWALRVPSSSSPVDALPALFSRQQPGT